MEADFKDIKFIVSRVVYTPDKRQHDPLIDLAIWLDSGDLGEGDLLSCPPEYPCLLQVRGLGLPEGDGKWKYLVISRDKESTVMCGDVLQKIGSIYGEPAQSDAPGAILGFFSAFDGVVATDSPNQPKE